MTIYCFHQLTNYIIERVNYISKFQITKNVRLSLSPNTKWWDQLERVDTRWENVLTDPILTSNEYSINLRSYIYLIIIN